MNLDTFYLIVSSACIAALSVYAFRKLNLLERDGDEIGAAIMAFGRAFPGEAIREAQPTVDFSAVFFRLSDGKTGCMQNFRRHAVCRILKPRTVRVAPSESDARALHLEFGDRGLEDGDFHFKDASQAAEVSLWFLGSMVANDDTSANVDLHSS